MNRPSSPAACPTERPTERLSTLRLASGVLAAAALVGCSSAPLSYLNDNQVYYKTVINRYPVRVVAVDGAFQAFQPVPIGPGEHVLTVDAVPVAGFSVPVQKQVPLTVAPCTRYYVAAQRRSPLLQDWEFVVEETWPVAGCDPAKEIEKARTAGASSTLVPKAVS